MVQAGRAPKWRITYIFGVHCCITHVMVELPLAFPVLPDRREFLHFHENVSFQCYLIFSVIAEFSFQVIHLIIGIFLHAHTHTHPGRVVSLHVQYLGMFQPSSRRQVRRGPIATSLEPALVQSRRLHLLAICITQADFQAADRQGCF